MCYVNTKPFQEIRQIVQDTELLDGGQAELFVYHLGDLCDSAVELPTKVSEFRKALDSLADAPGDTLLGVGYLQRELEHIESHVRGVIEQANKLWDAVGKRCPDTDDGDA